MRYAGNTRNGKRTSGLNFREFVDVVVEIAFRLYDETKSRSPTAGPESESIRYDSEYVQHSMRYLLQAALIPFVQKLGARVLRHGCIEARGSVAADSDGPVATLVRLSREARSGESMVPGRAAPQVRHTATYWGI